MQRLKYRQSAFISAPSQVRQFASGMLPLVGRKRDPRQLTLLGGLISDRVDYQSRSSSTIVAGCGHRGTNIDGHRSAAG